MPPDQSLSFNKVFKYAGITFITAGVCSKASFPNVHTLGDRYSHALACGLILRGKAISSSSDDVNLRLTMLPRGHSPPAALAHGLTPGISFSNLAKLDGSNPKTSSSTTRVVLSSLNPYVALEMLRSKRVLDNCPSFSVVTIVYKNCNGSGSAVWPDENIKMIFTTFLVKHPCFDVSASVMTDRNVLIPSPMTSLLGIDTSVRRCNSPQLSKWSFEPAIFITCGSKLTTLCKLFSMSTDCPQSILGATRTITSGQNNEWRV